MTSTIGRSAALATAMFAAALVGCISAPDPESKAVAPPPQAAAPTSTPAPAALDAGSPYAVRVTLVWRESKQDVLRIVGTRAVTDDADLEAALRAATAGHDHDAEPPLVRLDARGEVPWKDVVAVINMCKRVGIERMEFGFGGDR